MRMVANDGERVEAKHPAKFNDALIPYLARGLRVGGLRAGASVLDPFAGVGRIHELYERWGFNTVGVEIEPEWACQHPRNVVGNSMFLPFPDNTFDAVVSSPTYGNRMADHHNAKDGSRRHTYKHYLGRDLNPNNTGQIKWSPQYRLMHSIVMVDCLRVLKPGGVVVWNVKDHYKTYTKTVAGQKIKQRRRNYVTKWHRAAWMSGGCEVICEWEVKTPGMRHGENGEARVDGEMVYVFRGPG